MEESKMRGAGVLMDAVNLILNGTFERGFNTS